MNMEKINAAGIRLRCPQCHAGIAPPHHDKTGGVICGSCAATFPVHERFIDFLPAASGALSTAAEYERLFSGAADGREPVLYYGKTIHEEAEEFFGETGYHKECLPGKKILDAGCGLGRLSRYLSAAGAHVVACDIHKLFDRFPAAAGNNEPVYLSASVDNIPVADASFDCVWCQGVLCYTSDPVGGISELKRLVRPGGVLCLWIQNTEELGVIYRLARWGRSKPRPVRALCVYAGGWILTAGHVIYNLLFRRRFAQHQGFLNMRDWMAPEVVADIGFEEVKRQFESDAWRIERAVKGVFTKIRARKT